MKSSLTVVAKVFSNTLIFLLKKCEAKATHIFSVKIGMYLSYFKIEISMSY